MARSGRGAGSILFSVFYHNDMRALSDTKPTNEYSDCMRCSRNQAVVAEGATRTALSQHVLPRDVTEEQAVVPQLACSARVELKVTRGISTAATQDGSPASRMMVEPSTRVVDSVVDDQP